MPSRAALVADASILCGLLAGCAKPVDFGPAVAPSPGAVTGMHHILLTVSDLGRSLRFY